MAYEKQADEHERLMRLRFTLQRKYDACPQDDVERLGLLRAAIAEVDDHLDRLRRVHRGPRDEPR
jgi:hypothetical protein